MEDIRKEPDLFSICEKNSVIQFSKLFNISSEEKKTGEIQLFQWHKQVFRKTQTIHKSCNLKTKLN